MRSGRTLHHDGRLDVACQFYRMYNLASSAVRQSQMSHA
jgi:hypothetical protein